MKVEFRYISFEPIYTILPLRKIDENFNFYAQIHVFRNVFSHAYSKKGSQLLMGGRNRERNECPFILQNAI